MTENYRDRVRAALDKAEDAWNTHTGDERVPDEYLDYLADAATAAHEDHLGDRETRAKIAAVINQFGDHPRQATDEIVAALTKAGTE